MEEIVIAIRTAKRINTIEEHTLKVIKDLPYKVYIFCPEYEKRDYLKKYKGKYTITNGGDEGTHLCNQKIVDYFAGGKKIVQMDDDIKGFLEWNGEKFINGDLQHYIEEGFRLCERENYKLFGFYPVKNGFFMKDLPDVSKGLQFCMGGIHGFINDKSLRTIDNYRDDYERCILNYLKYGGCIRFNKCKADNIIYVNEGGQAKSRTIDNMTASTEYMVNTYPDYCRVKKCKSPYPEIQIKNRQYCIKHHLQRQLNLITWEKNCDRPNVSGLDEEKSKNRQNRVGFPCYSYTFGYIRPRRAIKGTLQLTKITEKYPLIYRLANDLCKSLEPEHQFTTITINKDIVCQPHTDKYNNGDSLIISLGDYTEGGNLYIEEKDGTIKKYDTRKPLYFNGAKYKHWNDKANSQRFSFVYFKLD
jgi:hypothetical protein